MIAGLSSSGIATAIRTAGRARETMDTMSRQIATGQRVSSVKDDGAAWGRAAGLRSQVTGTQALRTNLERLQMVFTVNAAATEARMEAIEPLEQNALAAMDPGLSASARAALQAAQSIPPSSAASIGAASHDQFSSSGARFTFNSLDADNQLAVLVSDAGATQTYQGSGFATAPAGSTTDLSTPATAATARQLILDSLALQRSRLAYWGSVANGLEHLESHLSRAEDRLQAGIGSLTDTDLGKASAARAQAETRQQLALSTVRQAISAYSSFATGLLGNVQRTQRAVA
jgi:flagellin-like hook-associated protein FlgL